MKMRKNGILKKIGCVLISASIILTGITFFGSSVSEADQEEVQDELIEESGNNSNQSDTDDNEISDIIDRDESDANDEVDQGEGNVEETDADTNDAENSVGEDETSEDLESSYASLKKSMALRSTTLLAASSSSDTEPTIEGSTLVYVPAGVGSSYTIPDGITAISTDAFSDSNVTSLTFTDASDFSSGSIGSQSGWPSDGTKIYIPNNTSDEASYVVSYFNALITEDRNIEIHFSDTDDETSYTIKYQFLNGDGEVVGSETITTTTTPNSYTPTNTYEYNSITYTLKSDTPTVSGTTYTYIYSTDETIEYTIAYQLLSSAGAEVTTIEVTTTTAPGTYEPPSTYAYNGTTYSLTTSTPTVDDTTYTYVYKASSSGGGGGGGSSSGGSSGGTSSVSSGGSSSGSGTAAAGLSDAAKTTAKYNVTEGANQIIANKGEGPVRIVCDGPVSKLVYILMDGNIIDKGNYTIESGSTILTLTANYVASLADGDHAVQFQYTDGYAITGLRVGSTTKTTTTVTYRVNSDGSISSGHTKDATPTTADGFDNRYLLCLAIFLLGAGTILFSRQKKLEALMAGDRGDE